MKRIICLVAGLWCLLSGLTFANQNTTMETKTLVAYFSATGTTRAVALQIAEISGAEVYEITPAVPYSPADLNWRNEQSRSSVEMADPAARPALAEQALDINRYDTVYLGFPIWWNLPPRIIQTFVERFPLQGKTIIPFATSGSSTISNSVHFLIKTYPSLQISEGRLLNHATPQDIRAWLKVAN
ncbi:MAG: flavodoxin [Paludibacteraceae bacterium]